MVAPGTALSQRMHTHSVLQNTLMIAKQGPHPSREIQHCSSPTFVLLPCPKPSFLCVSCRTLPLLMAVILQSLILSKMFEAWIPSLPLPSYSEIWHEEQQLPCWNPACLCMTTISHFFKFSHSSTPDADTVSMTTCCFTMTKKYLKTYFISLTPLQTSHDITKQSSSPDLCHNLLLPPTCLRYSIKNILDL